MLFSQGGVRLETSIRLDLHHSQHLVRHHSFQHGILVSSKLGRVLACTV